MRYNPATAGAESGVVVRVPDPADPEGPEIVVTLPPTFQSSGRSGSLRRLQLEVSEYVARLHAKNRIGRGTGPLPRGATHRLVLQPDGTLELIRERFT